MSGLARNHLQVALQCLLGQLPDHLTDDDPMAVDKEYHLNNSGQHSLWVAVDVACILETC